MKISLAQLTVTDDIALNTNKVLSALDRTELDEWMIFPEGMISGYDVRRITREALFNAISAIQYKAMERRCHCIIGSILLGDAITAAALYINVRNQTYTKNVLEKSEQRHFQTGDTLPILQTRSLTFGLQMGLEVLFPEQWRYLRQKGAQIIFHLNNTLNAEDSIWRHVLISRALENQMFVCSVNAAAPTQTLPSLLISPNGEVLLESTPTLERVITTRINLNTVSDDLLRQSRTDLIRLVC